MKRYTIEEVIHYEVIEETYEPDESGEDVLVNSTIMCRKNNYEDAKKYLEQREEWDRKEI